MKDPHPVQSSSTTLTYSTEVDDTPAPTETEPSPSTNSADLSVTPDAMELALIELKTTIEEAQQYQSIEQPHPQHLTSHINALKEDAEMLASFQTSDDALRTQATQTIFEARRLKRHLERARIDAEIQGKQSISSSSSAADEKSSGLKLPPLKLPEFSGEVAQFSVFRNFFEENILNSTTLTDTAKWLRLKESLSGAAAELVSEIPQTPHTLKIAWKLLLQVYGGDDKPIVELYDKLQRLQPALNQTVSLRLTHSKLEGILLSLEHLGHDIERNQFVRWVVLSKYPSELMYQVPQQKNATLAELRTAISEIIAIRETADYHRSEPTPVDARKKYTKVTSVPPRLSSASTAQEIPQQTKTAPFRPKNCVFCTQDHWNDSCPTYVTASVRKQKISGKCFKCLQPVHEPAKCLNVKRCFHCDSYEHNRALCPTKFPDESPATNTNLAIIQQETQKTGYFLTFITKAVNRESNQQKEFRVVVDTAGGATLMTKLAAEALKFSCDNRKRITYSGLNGTHLTEGYQLNQPVHLSTLDDSVLTVYPNIVEAILDEVPVPDIVQFRKKNPEFAEYEIPQTGEGRPVDLLLGSDSMVDLLKPEKIIEVDGDTFLIPTKMGWLILGGQKEHRSRVGYTVLFNTTQNPLKLMSDVEFVGLTNLHNTDIEEEQAAIQHFYQTVRFEEGRYSISWPWRTDPPNLDTNYGLALGRLRSLYKRLQVMPHLLQEYHRIITNQETEGIIEKVEIHKTISPYLHYLPHHPVLQPEKSTAIRLVYDGAATTGPKKLSLNDNILKGTKWLNDLIATLIRFRKHRIALTADIAKAFHQISINQSDRDVVRFVWIKNPEQPPIEDNLQIYRFKRVAFGIIASPFILYAVIKHHAEKQESNLTLNTIIRDLYADNLVTNLDEAHQPTQFYQQAKLFFKSMSMNLTKWTTNDENVRNTIPEEDQLTDTVQPVLGLKWSTHSDRLNLKMPKTYSDTQPTRRIVAREMASIFDPLGWITPVILLAKIFFRKIWVKTEKWDHPLADDDRLEWNAIREKMREIVLLSIPRRMFEIPFNNVQLHTFVDASQQAYAVVTYIRAQHGDRIEQSIVASRNRLAPKKQLTIPKLELAALVLGCRFTKFVEDSLKLENKPKTYIWSDSKCVLAWVRQKRLLPPVIHKYIQEASTYQINEFYYVPSELNYADIATRGGSMTELTRMQWWTGPSWLREEASWPVQNPLPEPETEKILLTFPTQIHARKLIVQEEQMEGIATLKIRSFSSLTRLFKITAICLFATQRLLKNKKFPRLDQNIDLQAARRKWIAWDQAREYALSNEPEAGVPFNLHNIAVFRDGDGLIRCQTRLQNSFFDIDATNPVLLVKDSTLTKLIVLHLHTLHNHAGTSFTLAQIRKEFWLPHGRRQVYKIIFGHCYRCRRNTAQPYPTPPPIPLPDFRVSRTQKPFQVIGLDIFGPMLARQNPGRNQPKQKIWGIIFTCAVIRAIHIEALEEMTTQEILFAFRRFIARRGVPHIIVSDNAPQFHELNGCLMDLWKSIEKDTSFSSYLSDRRIAWKFITDTSPWMGGFYERLIKIVKKSLEFTYGSTIMLKRQLIATLIEIEGIVNARPITYVDREIESPILTPSDFLTATYTAIPIQTAVNSTDTDLQKLWKSSQEILEKFWRHWSDYYLLMLRERNDRVESTTHHAQQQPQKGDIVVMIDVTKQRSKWQIAVVERLIKSQDKIVRSVQIRIPNGSRLIRPVVNLAPLRLKIDLPNITDEQLNIGRRTITVWPPGGAVQGVATVETDGEAERSNQESDASGEGGGAAPYRSNGLENGLGSAAAELEARGASTAAANSRSPGSVVENHEVQSAVARERSEQSAGSDGSSA